MLTAFTNDRQSEFGLFHDKAQLVRHCIGSSFEALRNKLLLASIRLSRLLQKEDQFAAFLERLIDISLHITLILMASRDVVSPPEPKNPKTAPEVDFMTLIGRSEPRHIMMMTALVEVWNLMNRETQLQAFMDFIEGALYAKALPDPDYTKLSLIAWHALGTEEQVLSWFYEFSHEPLTADHVTQTVAKWRAHGLTWLADHYEPLAIARIGTDEDGRPVAGSAA